MWERPLQEGVFIIFLLYIWPNNNKKKVYKSIGLCYNNTKGDDESER